jgi:hypothetical protein
MHASAFTAPLPVLLLHNEMLAHLSSVPVVARDAAVSQKFGFPQNGPELGVPHLQARSFLAFPVVFVHTFVVVHVLLVVSHWSFGAHFGPPSPPHKQACELCPLLQSAGWSQRAGTVLVPTLVSQKLLTWQLIASVSPEALQSHRSAFLVAPSVPPCTLHASNTTGPGVVVHLSVMAVPSA